jgi:2-amino-4-hydroxy-6-hydroxymethyldihydropteridine diphosphokinase
MTRSYIALGTNLGDRLLNLGEARRRLSSLGVTTRGPVIETAALLPPEDPTPQAAYLNTVDALDSPLDAQALFRSLKTIERHLGRRVTTRWAPRLIDLDLVLHGDTVLDTPDLMVPHPRMHERRFVLEPLAMIAPNAMHPVLHQSARQLLVSLERSNRSLRR